MTILQILIKYFPEVRPTAELKTVLGQYVKRKIKTTYPYWELQKVKEGNYMANDYLPAMVPDIIVMIKEVYLHL